MQRREREKSKSEKKNDECGKIYVWRGKLDKDNAAHSKDINRDWIKDE